MISLRLTSYEMELGFYELFTSYEMELETYVHVQIENQLEFHELKIACYWFLKFFMGKDNMGTLPT